MICVVLSRARPSSSVVRAIGALLVASACAGCGSSGDANGDRDAGTDALADVASDAPSGCAPGELRADDGRCVSAGVSSCADGFASDGAGGCSVVLPSAACAPGTMAVPGETSCREVAPCAAGAWGDIPVDATTQYVDAWFFGTSDGSSKAPWKTIGAAVTAASSGAIVAVAAGSYTEIVQVTKPVKLWATCPSKVEMVGKTTAGHTAPLEILSGADGTEVHRFAFRGEIQGAYLSGAKNVWFDRVWIHGTSRGLEVDDLFAPADARLTDSLVESASGYGLAIYGATVSVDRSVVRDIVPYTDGSIGECMIATLGSKGGSSTLTVSSSVVERCLRLGIDVVGSSATITATSVRDVQSEASTGDFGRPIGAEQDGPRANLVVRGCVLERGHDAGIFVGGSDALIEDTVVRSTLPQAATSKFGRGMILQVETDSRETSTVTIRSCLVDDSYDVGLFVAAADVTVLSTIVRNTKPRASNRAGGRGVQVEYEASTGLRSTLVMRGSIVDTSYDTGIFVLGSDATVDGVLVRGTKPSAVDGLFGDDLAVMMQSGPASLTVTGSRFESSARAGLSSFGAQVSVQGSTFECNGLDLDGEAVGGASYAFTDGGGNACGCSGTTSVCQIRNSGLAPPTSVP